VKVAADKIELAAPTADASLTDDLLACIGKSLKDKQVREVLTRAGMPIGKVIDQQANPALGVSYMGSKIKIGSKSELAVTGLWFYAAGQESYIRGIGAKIKFKGYPNPLPKGVAIGDARKVVAKKLGKPKKTYEDHDYWAWGKGLKLTCSFKRDKLVEFHVFIPYDDE
jgi:hypothetical protein